MKKQLSFLARFCPQQVLSFFDLASGEWTTWDMIPVFFFFSSSRTTQDKHPVQEENVFTGGMEYDRERWISISVTPLLFQIMWQNRGKMVFNSNLFHQDSKKPWVRPFYVFSYCVKISGKNNTGLLKLPHHKMFQVSKLSPCFSMPLSAHCILLLSQSALLPQLHSKWLLTGSKHMKRLLRQWGWAWGTGWMKEIMAKHWIVFSPSICRTGGSVLVIDGSGQLSKLF